MRTFGFGIPESIEQRQKLLWLALIFVWVSALIAGGSLLWHYSHKPGPSPSPLSIWPSNSSLRRAADRPTLVMFVHPQCPCTRASLSELALIYTRSQRKPKVIVAFYAPHGTGADWTCNDKWSQARLIPNAELVKDVDGKEMSSFGAKTSGQCYVFSADGQLVFGGGVTGTRGHEGDNRGMSLALEAINTSRARSDSSVYGCLLE